MNSKADAEDFGTPESRFRTWLDNRQREVDVKHRYIEAIVAHAKSQGLEVTEERVSRHYNHFKNWHEGILPTGHLMRITGVKYRNQRKRKTGQ